MRTPADFCAVMGLSPETAALLEPVWENSCASCPEDGPFPSLPEMEKWYTLSGADPAFLPILRQVREACRQNPDLRLYAWIAFRGLKDRTLAVSKLPFPDRLLKEHSGWFFLLLVLCLYPEMEKFYREKGIPLSYVQAACTSLPGLMAVYHAAHPDRQGVYPVQYGWMTYFLHGTMFRIGRLEYLIHPAPEFVPAVFRSRKTGRVTALCPEHWHLGKDGFLDRTGPHPDLIFSGDTVTGIPVSPCGKALISRRMTLDLKEYERIGLPDEIVPSCHIPGGGGLTPEKVLASFRDAVRFFREFLHQEIRMFCCDSWILSPEWEEALPDSNIAKFQRLVYRTPWYSRGNDGMFFLFGLWDTAEWAALPCGTSLQRAYLKQHFEGKRIGTGGMFILTGDLDRLTENWYMDRENRSGTCTERSRQMPD